MGSAMVMALIYCLSTDFIHSLPPMSTDRVRVAPEGEGAQASV